MNKDFFGKEISTGDYIAYSTHGRGNTYTNIGKIHFIDEKYVGVTAIRLDGDGKKMFVKRPIEFLGRVVSVEPSEEARGVIG